MDQDNRSNAEKTPEENKAAEFPPPPEKDAGKRRHSPCGKSAGESLLFYQTFLFLAASSFLVAFSSYCLIAPNNFATGGVHGYRHHRGKGNPRKSTAKRFDLCINAPLLILSFFCVKKKFAILSMLNVVMQTVWLTVMEHLNMPQLIFEEKIFAALAGGIGIGAAIAFAFKLGGSTGGMDIVAVMVQKKFPAPSIAWMIFILNCIVTATSFFVYKVDGDVTASVLPSSWPRASSTSKAR